MASEEASELTGVMKTLESHFKIAARGSTLVTELRAGTVTFLTMGACGRALWSIGSTPVGMVSLGSKPDRAGPLKKIQVGVR